MSCRLKQAAHFLLSPELACSPPNEAIINALLELGYEIDLFAPSQSFSTSCYDIRVTAHPVEYGKRWLMKNAWSPGWRKYALFSATSEDPLAVAGVLSWLHHRPFFALVDEIKSGSYYGDAPESWKRLCRWAMRQARFSIVNDEARIELLRSYAGIPPGREILVYPGCFREPPAPLERSELRRKWGFSDDALVLAASGGFNLTAGADWLVQAIQQDVSLHAVVQPLNLDPLARFLLSRIEGRERLFIEERRLSWREAWSSAVAFDIGMAIYLNPAPQFQHMGLSSNRLCMFLAMGVPVIGNRQPSFEFLEKFDCGVLIDSYDEFMRAILYIRDNLDKMRANCKKCFNQYIKANDKFSYIKKKIDALT